MTWWFRIPSISYIIFFFPTDFSLSPSHFISRRTRTWNNRTQQHWLIKTPIVTAFYGKSTRIINLYKAGKIAVLLCSSLTHILDIPRKICPNLSRLPRSKRFNHTNKIGLQLQIKYFQWHARLTIVKPKKNSQNIGQRRSIKLGFSFQSQLFLKRHSVNIHLTGFRSSIR